MSLDNMTKKKQHQTAAERNPVRHKIRKWLMEMVPPPPREEEEFEGVVTEFDLTQDGEVDGQPTKIVDTRKKRKEK